MKRCVIITLVTVIYFPAFAQLNNQFLEWPRTYEQADSGRFYAGFRTLGYLKNNEYFHDVIDGYTLFGYQVNPFIAWQAGRQVRFEGGIYLSQEFGEDEFDQILPTFTISYHNRNHTLLFGTLRGNLSHRLIEPLYDFENILNHSRMEYGVQYRLVSGRIFLDSWLAWRNAIKPGDADQEELMAGLSGEYRLMDRNGGGISGILQLTALHRGGQINDSDLPVETFLTYAAGLKGWVNYTGFLRMISLDAYYADSGYDGNSELSSYADGKGFYSNLLLQTHLNLGLMISYWNGQDFYSPVGGRLYRNFNETENEFGIERNLVFFRLLYENELADGLRMGIRGEPFLDLDDKEWEWSAGFYLNYAIQFKLGRTK